MPNNNAAARNSGLKAVLNAFSACLLLLLLLPGRAAGAEALELAALDAQYRPGAELLWLHDPQARFDADRLPAADLPDWQPLTEDVANFAYSEDPYWFRLSLRNSADEPVQRLLEVAYPLLDQVDLYWRPLGEETWRSRQSGDTRPFDARPVQHRHFVFPLTVAPGETLELRLRVQSSSSTQVPLVLWEPAAFHAHVQRDNVVVALYAGIMLAMVLYNLFVYVGTRTRAYLYYVVFIGASGLLMTELRGFTYQFLWPEAIWWQQHGIAVVLCALPAFGALFAAEFLRLRRHAPWMNKALRMLALLGFIGAGAALFLKYAIAVRLGVALVILWAPLLLLAGLTALLRGERAARYYLLAWVTFLAAAFITAIYQFGFIPRAFVGEYSLLIGSALEALLLSFALADRMNQLREDKDAAQREALRNLSRYQTLYEEARYGVFTTSLDGRIISGNPAFVELLGYDSLARMQEEVTDLERDLYLEPADRRRMLAELDQRGQVHAFETRMRRRDGSPVWVALSAHRLEQGDGSHIEGSLLDITERKQREAAERARAMAEKEKEAAKAAAQAKSSFLSNMSHEIRTPLTAVIGYGEYLLEPALDPARREQFARTIVRSGKHLLALLNDVLDLSKIEAERLRVESLPVNLFSQIADVQSVFEVRARDQGLSFHLDYHWPLPETIATDPTRLRQILYNLCGNAMKFTEQGGVTVEVRCDPQAQRLRIAVVDTGIGIPADKQGRIFQAFTQADLSTTRRHGGTGLGLTISRQLAERMGGSLRCSSEPGVGSRFELELPTGELGGVRLVHDAQHAPGAELAEEQPAQVPALRGTILHAEDNPDSRELVAMMVRRTGAEIVCVNDGAEAVARAWERPYDLVLMDVQMPVLDGFGALAELRAQGFTAPVVALTANVMAEDRARYHEAGFIACEPKPINRGSFYRLLARHLPAAHAEDASLRGRVLLAEDNADNQALIRWQLEKLGAEVALAEDGEQAVALAEGGGFDLVLMDLEMPVLDGAAATRRLLAVQPALPVYLLTATEAEEARRIAAESGCSGTLGKPLDADALRGVLRRHLRAQASAPAPEPPPPAAQAYDDLSDLIQRFLDGLPATLQAMDSARAVDDWQALRGLAHQLKGAGGSFGHPELSRLAAALEKAARAGDRPAVDEQLAALREAVARVCERD